MNTDAKKEFLRRWLQQQQSAPTIEQARKAVRQEFGEGLGTHSLNQTMQEVRKEIKPARSHLPAPTQLPIENTEPRPRKLVRDITTVVERTLGEEAEVKAIATVCGAAMAAAGIMSLKIEEGRIVVVVAPSKKL